jgi:hypothetical protein
MGMMKLTILFKQAYQTTALRPNMRAKTHLTLHGEHVHSGDWGDGRLDGLACELTLFCAERVHDDGYDKGGWFTKQSRSEWIAVHGEEDCFGRALIRKNLRPEMDQNHDPIGVPLELAIMLPEDDLAATVRQIRFQLKSGLRSRIRLILRSNALPRLYTQPRELDVSGDSEYPIVACDIEDCRD